MDNVNKKLQIGGKSRLDIIDKIGRKFLTINTGSGEFSYKQEIDRKIDGHCKIDLRFYDSQNKVVVLVETKKRDLM